MARPFAISLALIGSAASAQMSIEDAPVRAELNLSCSFAAECFEGEACNTVEFEPSLQGQMGGASRTDMVVEAAFEGPPETVPMLGVQSEGALSLFGGGFDARHLVTIAAGGAARYTVHYAEGPMVISYLGQCE